MRESYVFRTIPLSARRQIVPARFGRRSAFSRYADSTPAAIFLAVRPLCPHHDPGNARGQGADAPTANDNSSSRAVLGGLTMGGRNQERQSAPCCAQEAAG